MYLGNRKEEQIGLPRKVRKAMKALSRVNVSNSLGPCERCVRKMFFLNNNQKQNQIVKKKKRFKI